MKRTEVTRGINQLLYFPLSLAQNSITSRSLLYNIGRDCSSLTPFDWPLKVNLVKVNLTIVQSIHPITNPPTYYHTPYHHTLNQHIFMLSKGCCWIWTLYCPDNRQHGVLLGYEQSWTAWSGSHLQYNSTTNSSGSASNENYKVSLQ